MLEQPRTPPARRLRAPAVTALLLATLLLPGCGAAPPYAVEDCERDDLHGHSVARVWDEQALSLIRQVIPAPTVHARNLFHLSTGMWDAWAAYDRSADGYFVTEKHEAADPTAAREAAISYAAYRILSWRYATVSDLATAQAELDGTMARLCYRTDYTDTSADDPAAVGNRIAAAVIESGRSDRSLEDARYQDDAYLPVNDPLVVADPGTAMQDPNRWQPLALDEQIAQNGLRVPGKVQTFIGPHWGHVTPFALPPSAEGTPIDPGPPPRLGTPSEAAFKAAAVEVLRLSSQLDPADGVTIDIGPGAMGNNPLGTNDGEGHAANPLTGEPYPADTVLRADYLRAVVEFWADGPESETPPGHWNTLANAAGDALEERGELRIGDGPVADRLEWDVKTYLVLNGAMHDAAVAAWGLKGYYDSARPISMIRYMGGRGQSSDPSAPSYHPEGLPLAPGLIEVITPESSGPGERHAALADHVGEIAVYAWLGSPEDPQTSVSGVGWIRAVEWVPYQRPTFVTPSFAGYVSGHSTFSRAGAEVLTAITGSPFFPGGLQSWTIPAGSLRHEEGPTQDLSLEWATYYDAADQAGFSRLAGGIHIREDDFEGRRIGSQCGLDAWALAQRYFDGTARSG